MSVLDIIGTAGDFAKGLLDRVWPEKMSEEEKKAAALKVQEMIDARDNALVNASKEVLLAELNQSDTFTKRARPMIVYVGLGAIIFNHVFVPFVNRIIEWVMILKEQSLEAFTGLSTVNLPADFWYVWGGVCSVYALGRTAEKKGARNKIIGMITGNTSLHKNGG